MPVATPDKLLSLIAPGAQVVVRDEEWLVRAIEPTSADGVKVRCVGTSTLVRDAEATFLTKLDNVAPLRPEETRLTADLSPRFRASRQLVRIPRNRESGRFQARSTKSPWMRRRSAVR